MPLVERALRLIGEPTLEARLCDLDGAPLALVAPPHPLYGGRLDNPVVEALCEGLQRSGLSTLRFNYRGVGESEGRASRVLGDAVADYRCAVAWAVSEGRAPRVLAGYSYGALSAIEVHLAGQACAAIVAVAPPSAALAAARVAAIDGLFGLCHGDADPLVDQAEVREWLSRARRAQHEVLPGADHFFAYEYAAVSDFAARVAAAALASVARTGGHDG